MLQLILIILLILLLVGGLPTWPHMQALGWGYFPSGAVGVIIIVLLILLLVGRI